MEHSAILQLGVGGIFAVLIIREVLNFLKTRNGKTEGTGRGQELLRTIARETRDLHDWHRPDGRGEQTWKNSQMIDAVQDMKTAVENNTKVVDRLIPVLERMEHSQK